MTYNYFAMLDATPTLVPLARLEQAASVLRVLAHPHRLRICDLLLNGRLSVKQIADHLRIPGNAASQHLNMMKAHGILGCERMGKTVYYRVIDPRPGWLLACMKEHEGPPLPSVTPGMEQ
ncbi:MAG TPA: metalloregulator ArsR/SmtB family transcription factor [Phycisphaerae bacterium]|nr:metalloregulator ArsR/SmtB family transcription factor [Phycisphaerae bacterium]HRY67496.1 metalloregulator ArsR/SmtB family transcription factor [Phycisphaerae bacterium]